MGSLLEEAKRRQILKAVIAYVFVAYIFAQICIATFPVMRLPEWTIQALIILLVLAFPVAIFMAWTKEDEERKADAVKATSGRAEK